MDRGMIKWKPFNSVVPSSELLKKTEDINLPSLSKDEIDTLEELIKTSYYNKTILEIRYVKNKRKTQTVATVVKLDSINKNIYLDNHEVINFRQIYSIKEK